VRSLLQVIADFTNFNVVTSDTVTGAVTLRLKDVPWDQALDIILQAKGLGVRKNGNVLWIAPKDELAAKEKLDLEARRRSQGTWSRCARSRSSSTTPRPKTWPGLTGLTGGAGGGAAMHAHPERPAAA
jgi:type IV pilus assembly protein PilQ